MTASLIFRLLNRNVKCYFYQVEPFKKWKTFCTLKVSFRRNINNISEMSNKIVNLNLDKRIDQYCWNHGMLYFESFITTIKFVIYFLFYSKSFKCTFFCDIQ